MFGYLRYEPRMRFTGGGGSSGGGGGGGGNTTTVQKADPWGGQQPFLSDVYARAQKAADQTPTKAYEGKLTADPNSFQQYANTARLDLANFLGPNFGQAALQNAQDTASGKYLLPGSNPTLQPAIDAALAPTLDKAKNFVMPQVASQAWKSGAYGGTDHAKAINQAMLDSVTRPAAEVSGKIAYDNYTRERGLQLQAPQIAQSAMQMAQMQPGLVAQYGNQLQGWEQQILDDAITKYQLGVEAPWQAIAPYANIIQNGYPGGSSTTDAVTSMAASGGNRMGGALAGGIMGGAGAYGLSMLAPEALGFLGGPWGIAGGALLGGLMGGLF